MAEVTEASSRTSEAAAAEDAGEADADAPEAQSQCCDAGRRAASAKAVEDDSDSDAETPENRRVLVAIDRVLDEWLVTGLHRAAARKFIKERVGNAEDSQCDRLRRWLLLRMNGRVWQHGIQWMCNAAENIPDLRSHHVWPRDSTAWLADVEARHAEILEELMQARGAAGGSGFQPYRDPVSSSSKERVSKDGLGAEGVDSGSWNVLYLYLNHKHFEENCARFPATIRAIEETFPRQYSHAFFSALTPGSHIVKHHGPSNRMLRVWLPLCGLEGFRLRVGDTVVHPKAGEAFVWDHSFEHEAWHDGEDTRIVLIVDIWHPDLADPEVKFLRTLQNCRLRAGRALLEQCDDAKQERDATYFDIVERARHLLTDDDWWVVKAERDPTTKPT